MSKYVLDGRKVVRTDFKTWMNFFERGTRRLANNTINGRTVSTVFIGDVNCLFETMMFAGNESVDCERAFEYEEAMRAHVKMCLRAAGLKPRSSNG